jgi:Lrp/AsnC family transcriptional regulator for asnA, asnC and gidA
MSSQCPPEHDHTGLDPVEVGVLRALRDDGRATASRIAADLGVPEPKVRQKLDRLLRSGAVAVVALVDPAVFGRNVLFLLRIRTTTAPRAVAGIVAAMPAIHWVVTTQDLFTVQAQGSVGSYEELLALVNTQVRTLPQVRSVDVDLPLRIYEANFAFDDGPYTGSHPEVGVVPWKRGGNEKPLDTMDLALLSALEDEPRASFTALAERVGLSVPSTRQRVRRLLLEDIVRVQARPVPEQLGRESTAIVRLTVSGDTTAIARALVAMPAATSIVETTGVAGIEAEFTCWCTDHLTRCVEEVATLPGVERVTVEQYDRVIKSSGRW